MTDELSRHEKRVRGLMQTYVLRDHLSAEAARDKARDVIHRITELEKAGIELSAESLLRYAEESYADMVEQARRILAPLAETRRQSAFLDDAPAGGYVIRKGADGVWLSIAELERLIAEGKQALKRTRHARQARPRAHH